MSTALHREVALKRRLVLQQLFARGALGWLVEQGQLRIHDESSGNCPAAARLARTISDGQPQVHSGGRQIMSPSGPCQGLQTARICPEWRSTYR